MSRDSVQILEFLQGHLQEAGRVSLVEALSYFDFHNHSIPSVSRVNKALARLAIPVQLTDGYQLEALPREAHLAPVQLTEEEWLAICNQYRSALRGKPAHP